MAWSPKLGEYPILPLADTRSRAREWLGAVIEGRPASVPVRNAMTFAEMAGRYVEEVLPAKRSAKACEQLIDRELLPTLGARKLTSITQDDLVSLLKAIAERSPHAARKALSELKVMLSWAAFNRIGSLQSNPAAHIPPRELLRGLSYNKARDRVLFDSELRLIWRAASETPYPLGPLVKTLILTGQRLNEVARARWSEIDHDTGCLVIPAARMKGKAVHALPLTERMCGLFDELPRFDKGDFVFSTTFGERPISGFSKMKSRLDQAIAELGQVNHWQLHDLRRTMRTGMSTAGVGVFHAELALSHTQSGVHATYDRHRYQKEVLAALTKWEGLLFGQILAPPPDNVVPLAAIDGAGR